MEVTYYGQSCVVFDFNGSKILLDPFITYNPLAKDIDVNVLNPDYIFLTHCHQDHVADMKNIQSNSGATVAAVVETAAWVRKQGVPDEKVIEYNFGGTLSLPFGKVKMVYALHTNSTPEGDYAGVPVGYVFFVDDKKIYFAGDTALTLEMKLLEDLALDWAFLPIGGHYTMDVDDAIKAAQFVNCKNIIGVHYDTFPPIRINTEEAKQKFEANGLRLYLPKIGESVAL
ncbi:metal-dependent hydrolase [Sphingobacterium phlebotomi]|uniref:Metal-dependent hydrolase n=1 Tax=Sphingobacterium phlebotomi TaxID=2605433 RepID=A0A5D4H1R7_9SPHI|nr:metal-dependent hydrolase [Sphingobacterium phlebotomi]TYR34183.1 metal-dependent hydrolase [Sphingobacterium phlebotomi]